MRIARFDVKKVVKNGFVFWVIWVPGYLQARGKGGYMYFHTRAEAERKRGELLAAVRTQSRELVLSNAQVRDAQRAIERLGEAGLAMSLDRAVELALPHLRGAGLYMTVEGLGEGFWEAKEGVWSAASKRNWRGAWRLFLGEFGGMKLVEVTGRRLEVWLRGRFGSAGYRANVIRTLRPAFSWAVRQGWLGVSPFAGLERVRVRREGVDVFSPEEAGRLMRAAEGEGCAAAVAMLLFAGIRPGELTRLRWGDVRDGFIHVRPAVAKTGQVRNVEVEGALGAFLEASGGHGAQEPVCPRNWKRRMQAVRREAGLTGRQDAARHSYASYYLAKYKDADALKLNMGHSRGSDVLFLHYRAAVTPEEAGKFWAIRPKV